MWRLYMENIIEIKNKLKDVDIEHILQALIPYQSDTRTGVKKLVAGYEKKYKAYLKELDRIESMKRFENKYDDFLYVCGIDEAGRGPLCGPVVAAAVILPKDTRILYIDDSKKLSQAKREILYDEIMEKAISVGVGFGSVELIDEINILNASKHAMAEAVGNLTIRPEVLLVDAVKIPGMDMIQESIIKGDAISVSIAAASIIAKVTRDRMLIEYDELYPEYDWSSNKGYGTKKHVEAIKKHGPSPIHRRTFIKNFI